MGNFLARATHSIVGLNLFVPHTIHSRAVYTSSVSCSDLDKCETAKENLPFRSRFKALIEPKETRPVASSAPRYTIQVVQQSSRNVLQKPQMPSFPAFTDRKRVLASRSATDIGIPAGRPKRSRLLHWCSLRIDLLQNRSNYRTFPFRSISMRGPTHYWFYFIVVLSNKFLSPYFLSPPSKSSVGGKNSTGQKNSEPFKFREPNAVPFYLSSSVVVSAMLH